MVRTTFHAIAYVIQFAQDQPTIPKLYKVLLLVKALTMY
jgi:hypothetical protein